MFDVIQSVDPSSFLAPLCDKKEMFVQERGNLFTDMSQTTSQSSCPISTAGGARDGKRQCGKDEESSSISSHSVVSTSGYSSVPTSTSKRSFFTTADDSSGPTSTSKRSFTTADDIPTQRGMGVKSEATKSDVSLPAEDRELRPSPCKREGTLFTDMSQTTSQSSCLISTAGDARDGKRQCRKDEESSSITSQSIVSASGYSSGRTSTSKRSFTTADDIPTQRGMGVKSEATESDVSLPAEDRELRPSPYFYYIDHSHDVDEDPFTPLSPALSVPNFIIKLHAILTCDRLNGVIGWMPHGRSWKILNQVNFSRCFFFFYFFFY